MPEDHSLATIVRRVCDALIAKGEDVVMEYPGYLHIQTANGRHYTTGTANATWTIDRIGTDMDTVSSIDTTIPTTENNARTIASAVSAAIAEDGDQYAKDVR